MTSTRMNGANLTTYTGLIVPPVYKSKLAKDVLYWLTSVEHYHVPASIVYMMFAQIGIDDETIPSDKRLALATIQAENFAFNDNTRHKWHWLATSDDSETFW